MNFGQRLKQTRQMKHMTQEKLADIVNVHLNSIGGWEKGTRTPDIQKLTALADALDTTVAYLTGETDNPDRAHVEEPVPTIAAVSHIVSNKRPDPVPGLEFWGAVVDAARKAAARRNPQEVSDIRMMLEKALDAITAVDRATRLELDNRPPVMVSV